MVRGLGYYLGFILSYMTGVGLLVCALLAQTGLITGLVFPAISLLCRMHLVIASLRFRDGRSCCLCDRDIDCTDQYRSAWRLEELLPQDRQCLTNPHS